MIRTLSGSNALTLQQELQRCLAEFTAQHGDLAVERFDASQTDVIVLQDALTALPFLANRRLVVIDSPSASSALGERITELLDGVPETTDVIFVEPKFDKRSVIYKTLKKRTDFQEFAELQDAQLSSWMTAYVKEQGGNISSATARALLQRVGPRQLRLKSELDKLMAYNPNIDGDSVALLVSATPQSSTFDLLEAALSGNAVKAQNIYEDQRRQRVEPQAILGLLAWQLHVLATVKAAGDRSADTIAKDAKLNPYVVRKTQSLTRSMTMTAIKELVAQTLQLDYTLKTVAIDADEALQNLILVIARTK